jgi:ActR/RegA family two-component response regulator
MKEKTRNWRALAAKAAVETDPLKLRNLVEELNQALDEGGNGDAEAVLPAVPIANVEGLSKRLLFVDDEPSIRLTLPAILQNHGFDVCVAATVNEAISEIAKKEFDVLLSDLNIGSERDGFDVVKAMRQAHPQCITILLTGYPAFETAVEGIRHQIDDYVVKPADIESLVKLMNDKLIARQNFPS